MSDSSSGQVTKEPSGRFSEDECRSSDEADQKPLTRTLTKRDPCTLSRLSSVVWNPPNSGTFPFLWGDNAEGQVFTGTMGDCVKTPTLIEKLGGRNVIGLALGVSRSYAISSDGKVWAGGLHTEAQLSLDDAMTPYAPCKPMLLSIQNVKAVSCGTKHTVFLLSTGAALSCGSNEFGQLAHGPKTVSETPLPPRMIVGLSEISQVCCGDDFTIILCRSGQVHSAGNYVNGCLGRRASSDLVPLDTAQPIPSLAAMPIDQIATGGAHVLALTMSGALYGWGLSKRGRIGLGPNVQEIVYEPQRLRGLPPVKIIAAGRSHSLAIVVGSKVYVTGSNLQGQLGIPKAEKECLWNLEELGGLKGVKVKQGVCGEYHSLVLSDEGRLFCWGSGEYGLVCGEGIESKVLVDGFENMDVCKISAGGYSCGCIAIMENENDHMYNNSMYDNNNSNNRVVDGFNNIYKGSNSIILSRQPSLVRSISRQVSELRCLRVENSVEAPGHSTIRLLKMIKDTILSDCIVTLKNELSRVFSDAHRMNFSFSYSGRKAVYDSQGVNSIFEALIDMMKDMMKDSSSRDDNIKRSTIHSNGEDISNQMKSHFTICLSNISPYVSYLQSTEQIRFLVVLLQCPMLNNQTLFSDENNDDINIKHPDSSEIVMEENHNKKNTHSSSEHTPSHDNNNRQDCDAMGLLVSTIFQLGFEGRSALMKLLVTSLPVHIMELRVLGNLKSYIVSCIKYYGSKYQYANKLWQAIWLLQLIRLSIDEAKYIGLSDEIFIINDINSLVNPLKEYEIYTKKYYRKDGIFAFNKSNIIYNMTTIDDSWTFFLAHINICPVEFKRKIITIHSLFQQRCNSIPSILEGSNPWFLLKIRRPYLIHDTYKALQYVPKTDRLKPLKIIFDLENAVDEGGLTKEFFTLLIQEILNPAFGMFNAHSGLLWIKPSTQLDQHADFYFLGLIVSLALHNDIMLELPFPLALYKKLQNEHVGLAELSEIQPEEARSFEYLLSVEDPVAFEAQFGTMAFEITTHDFGEIRTIQLIPNGSSVSLTFNNRAEFVELYVQYLLVTSVARQFAAFKAGIYSCAFELMESLSAKELRSVICGADTYDFADLEAGATYSGGFEVNMPYIRDFWKIVLSLSLELKRKFLRFCTGSDRVPLGGLSKLNLRVQRNGSEPTDRLPTAFTCFNALLLPEYSDTHKLEQLLILAIENSEGFGLE